MNNNNDEYARYYQENSDLDFELLVNESVKKCGCMTSHAGRYQDPLSEKIREFDILATRSSCSIAGISENRCFHKVDFAIECKNVTAECPVIVGTRAFDAEHTFASAYHKSGDSVRFNLYSIQFHKMLFGSANLGGHFINHLGVEAVQVARKSDGQLRPPDRSSTYDKWSQAVNHSIYRNIEFSKYVIGSSSSGEFNYWCVPIMVVPDERLLVATRNSVGINVEMVNTISIKMEYAFDINGVEITGVNSRPTISSYYLMTISGVRGFLRLFQS